MAKLGYPFTLGVASGEPLPDGVILWTRLAPEPLHPTRPGGMPNQAMAVQWQLAEDEAFARVVQSGTASAQPDWAHSVHVRVTGLRPATEYFYRFSIDGHSSQVGRTKTAPDPASTAPVRFGVVSCQRYEHGFFTALRHLADERPDVILHLGDYIYEYGKPAHPKAGRYVRPLESEAECRTLGDYRNRYARYHMDADLQAAHAAAPWIAMPDDHEVRDNYSGALPGDGTSPAAFLKRRAAAFKAYYEHLPLRVRPSGPSLQNHRWRPYGRVVDFVLVDARQHREGRDMLGPEQEQWLAARLKGATARWKVLAQAVFFAQRKFPLEPPSTDAWDGFPESRARVLAEAPDGLVVLSGDVHNGWACDLRADWADPASKALGVEFVGTSVTSMPPMTDATAILALNPHIAFFDHRRGYLSCTASMDDFQTDYRVVDFVDRPGAPVSTAAGFRVKGNKLQRTDL
ncbi:alkaline phosphatase D family protein [Planotetraspora sp. A-T 1434]|uniref:alkaline phosphatase D family protein n=1 Tax=Planotetraspora sp. A-T 1434 TaxID=2979219 RepID=UPI0021BEC28B|nr:alkaline phosphatase D family protein [Planotetraspora sp. A-T 1434]MCT9934006.1 alkaline phosphatase D family protein [Planotetraspora sp. A-T 1434]